MLAQDLETNDREKPQQVMAKYLPAPSCSNQEFWINHWHAN